MEDRKEINKDQARFYNEKKKNLPTRLWYGLRNGLLKRLKKDLGVEKKVYDLHRTWLGDLSGKKILDLGCYEGNSLSYYLAENSKEYIGIDLSEKGIAYLSRRLAKIPSAKAIVEDFLSPEFREKDFDIIYAYGVLHHFKKVDELIDKLDEKLAPGGIIISHDPLKTSKPIALIRMLYRPFQSDRRWEWPFGRKTYSKFSEAFNIEERRGFLAKAKWYFLLNLLPLSSKRKRRLGEKWVEQDWRESAVSEKRVFQSMHLSLLMRKRNI